MLPAPSPVLLKHVKLSLPSCPLHLCSSVGLSWPAALVSAHHNLSCCSQPERSPVWLHLTISLALKHLIKGCHLAHAALPDYPVQSPPTHLSATIHLFPWFSLRHVFPSLLCSHCAQICLSYYTIILKVGKALECECAIPRWIQSLPYIQLFTVMLILILPLEGIRGWVRQQKWKLSMSQSLGLQRKQSHIFLIRA